MNEGASDSRNWFLRIATGTVFGPVSTKGLITWAAQGRAQAGNEISCDRKEWFPAETLPELGIEWYIEDAEGQLVGPFHRRAAEKLLLDERASGGAKLVAAADADLSRLRKPAERRKAADDDQSQAELDLTSVLPREGADAAVAEFVEERESLRLRIAELEEQAQNLLRAAERDGKAHARQLEAARRQIATMERQVEDLRAAPLSEEKVATDEDARQAMEMALIAAREEVEETRERLTAREEELVALRQETETADTGKRRIAELEAALAASRQEVGGARERLTAREEELTGVRQCVETLKIRISELVGQLAAQAGDNEAIEDLQRQVEAGAVELRKARENYAELLEFSNSRDSAHERNRERDSQMRAELQAQLDAAVAEARALAEKQAEAAQSMPARNRELAARLSEMETLVSGLLAEDRKAIELVLAAEREAFATLREGSMKRQSLLRERLAEVQRLQGGETDDVYERAAQARNEKADASRTQEALVALQGEHERYVRQAEARERELVSRVRLLQLEEERLKERAADAEPLYQRNRQLTERLDDREQKLAHERQQRSIEQAQLEQAQQALMAQIESARQAEETLPLKTDDDGADPKRPAFRVTPWMSLKK